MDTALQMPATILVVDDNPLIGNVLKSLLLSENYTVHVCSNGQEALKLLEERGVDVIICDVMMPHMDGYELHDLIRQRSELNHIPFIFLTALGDSEDIRKGRETGADDYLVKPFDPATLLSTVKGKVARARNLQSQSEARYETYRKRVVHTLSHEFRTPLVAINTGTELLIDQKDKLDSEKIQNLLEAIRRGGLRLEKLVNDFMLLQQIEAGVAQNLFRTRALNKSIKDVVRQFHANICEELQSQGCACTLTEHCDDSVVLMYEPQVLDILQRLVSNAVKFSIHEKSIELHLCPCGDEIAVEVRDRGIGIDPAQAREAIDVFGQINRDKLEQQGGGLGLAIANRYAIIHGGHLEFERREGGGSVVSLVLPVRHDS